MLARQGGWFDAYYLLIQGVDSSRNVLWEYQTDTILTKDCFYISDIGIYGNHYYFSYGDTVISLNRIDGKLEWINSGNSQVNCYDRTEDNMLVIGGCYGPVIKAIDNEGVTVFQLNEIDGCCVCKDIEIGGNIAKVTLIDDLNYIERTYLINLETQLYTLVDKDYDIWSIENQDIEVEDEIYQFFAGTWETNGQQPYGIKYTFDAQYRYCGEEYDPVTYQKTDYGYYVSVYTERGTGGYRLYNNDPDKLECIGDGDPYSSEGYSGTSSLHRISEEENVEASSDLVKDVDQAMGLLSQKRWYLTSSAYANVYCVFDNSGMYFYDRGTETFNGCQNSITDKYISEGYLYIETDDGNWRFPYDGFSIESGESLTSGWCDLTNEDIWC